MGRRPKSDPDVNLMVNDTPVVVATSTMQTLNAKAFIAHLLGRGVSPSVAGLYTRTAARSIRAGRAADPNAISNVAERTSVRAYWRWAAGAYAARVTPVRRKLLLDGRQLARLRASSVVPPSPTKTVPLMVQAPEVHLDPSRRTSEYTPPRFDWVPCNTWTLHVPTNDTTPVHRDPCVECTMYELSVEQVEVIAAAFEDAWGHRDLSQLPPEALLFGPVPPDADVTPRNFANVGRIVALVSANTPVADAFVPLRGVVTGDSAAFVARLQEAKTDHVLVSRDSNPALFARVLDAIGTFEAAQTLPSPAEEAAPVLTLVPPVESAPVPVEPVADVLPDDWSFVMPDRGPPVPPEVAVKEASSWWQKSQSEFATQFPHLAPKK